MFVKNSIPFKLLISLLSQEIHFALAISLGLKYLS